MFRWKEKPTGLKILWVWTFGTAAVLVTSVMTTRLRDMEKVLKEREEAAARTQFDGPAPSLASGDAVVLED